MVKCFSVPSGKVVCPQSKGFKGRKKQFDETKIKKGGSAYKPDRKKRVKKTETRPTQEKKKTEKKVVKKSVKKQTKEKPKKKKPIKFKLRKKKELPLRKISLSGSKKFTISSLPNREGKIVKGNSYLLKAGDYMTKKQYDAGYRIYFYKGSASKNWTRIMTRLKTKNPKARYKESEFRENVRYQSRINRATGYTSVQDARVKEPVGMVIPYTGKSHAVVQADGKTKSL